MNKELAYIILLPLSSFLVPLGGFRWKGWRRFILPICLFSVCLLFSVSLARSLGVGILCGISTSLPYGENSSWTMRIITAITFGIIGIPLGVSVLMVVPPIVGIIMLALSKWGIIQHKICEAVIGFAIALPIADLLYHWRA